MMGNCLLEPENKQSSGTPESARLTQKLSRG